MTVTWSIQLPHIPVTAFSQTDLFLTWIYCKFRPPQEPQWPITSTDLFSTWWHHFTESSDKLLMWGKPFVHYRFNAPPPGFAFQQSECKTSQREFLWKNFYSARILSSRRECYLDFASRQDSRRDPGEEFFSWRDPGEYRFPSRILAGILEKSFFLGGIPVSTDFSAGFLPR